MFHLFCLRVKKIHPLIGPPSDLAKDELARVLNKRYRILKIPRKRKTKKNFKFEGEKKKDTIFFLPEVEDWFFGFGLKSLFLRVVHSMS